jgi:hypothetical protein
MSSTRNNSPIIAIGNNRYYLGDIFDKNIHAAMDLTVFTDYGETRTIKKGEWIGVLFSYATVMGAPALLLYGDGGYFGKKTYYLRYYGPNTIDDRLLRYNYRNDKWVTLSSALNLIPFFGIFKDVFNGYRQKLPTADESDKVADERDQKDEELNKQDDMFRKIYLGAAVFTCFKALTAEETTEQLAYGGLSAYLFYEGVK